MDAVKNFSYGTVLTAPSPATTGTSLVLQSGEGALFPAPSTDGEFNIVVWVTGANPLSSNAEICRVTARTTDTLTITRQQEGTTARTIVVGDQVMLAPTKKVFDDLASTPSSTTTKVRAYRITGDQTITTATWTKVQLTGETFDPGSNFDAATNYRFTAPTTGYYLIVCNTKWSDAGAHDHYTAIYKNGSQYSERLEKPAAGTSMVQTLLESVSLNATDYIEHYVYQNSGTDKTIVAGSNASYMTIHLLSV